MVNIERFFVTFYIWRFYHIELGGVPAYKEMGSERFCRNCGTKLGPQDEFCPNCGLKVRREFPELQAQGRAVPKKGKGSLKWIWLTLALLVVCGIAFAEFSSGDRVQKKPHISKRSFLVSSKVGGKWGYIDKTGKFIWEPTK